MLGRLRVAVCGKLPTACAALRDEGIRHIDQYSDSLDLATNLRKGVAYHLIMVYAPQGEALTDIAYPYKVRLQGDWRLVPVRMLDEPACSSAMSELMSAIHDIAASLVPESP